MVASKFVTLTTGVGAAAAPTGSGFREVLQRQVAAPSSPAAVVVSSPEGATGGGLSERAAGAIERIQAAQKRMDQVMSLASSGRHFSPAELLSFQANVYRCSQEIDLAGKVVDKAGGGLRQILQTQL